MTKSKILKMDRSCQRGALSAQIIKHTLTKQPIHPYKYFTSKLKPNTKEKEYCQSLK